MRATGVLGGTFSPHCDAIHPARLVRGLADAVRRRGVQLYERTPVLDIQPGKLITSSGTVRAQYVIRATESYTARLPGLRRAVAPVYSLMIATAPLPEAAWDEIGLAGRPTFGDLRHLIIYGQRTADGRLAFGGRGAPYHLGSAVRPSFDRVPAVFAALRRTLAELFPVVGTARITHASRRSETPRHADGRRSRDGRQRARRRRRPLMPRQTPKSAHEKGRYRNCW